MLCVLTLAVQGVPTKPQQHVLNEMRDIDVVLKALLGDVKLERESATAKFLSTQATKNVDEKLSFEEFADKILAFETDPVPTEEELRARFAAVDINLDGFITKEEYLQAIRTHALWELTLSGDKVEETDLFDEGTALTVTAVANAMRTESRAYAMDPKPTGPFPVAALDDAAYDVVMAFVAEVKAGAATQDPPYDQLVFWSGLFDTQGKAAQQLFHATHGVDADGVDRARGVGYEYTTVETAGVGKYFTETLGFGDPDALKAEINSRAGGSLTGPQLNVAFKSMWDAFSIDFAQLLGNRDAAGAPRQKLPVNVFLRWGAGFDSDLSKDAARQTLEADFFTEMATIRSKTFGNFEGPIVMAALLQGYIEVVNIHFIDDAGYLLHKHPFTLLNPAHRDWYDDTRYEWLYEDAVAGRVKDLRDALADAEARKKQMIEEMKETAGIGEGEEMTEELTTEIEEATAGVTAEIKEIKAQLVDELKLIQSPDDPNIQFKLELEFDAPYVSRPSARTPATFPATIFGSKFKGGATSKNAGEFNLVKFSLAHEIFNLLKWRLATKPLNFFVPAPHALAEGEVAALVVSR